MIRRPFNFGCGLFNVFGGIVCLSFGSPLLAMMNFAFAAMNLTFAFSE